MQMIRLDVGQLRHARAQHIDQRCREVNLPDVPGLEPKALRDLYGAQYPELLSAEIDVGPLADGKQEFVFRKAVGTKGAGGASIWPRSHAISKRRMRAARRRSTPVCLPSWNDEASDAPRARGVYWPRRHLRKTSVRFGWRSPVTYSRRCHDRDAGSAPCVVRFPRWNIFLAMISADVSTRMR